MQENTLNSTWMQAVRFASRVPPMAAVTAAMQQPMFMPRIIGKQAL